VVSYERRRQEYNKHTMAHPSWLVHLGQLEGGASTMPGT